MGCVLGLTGPNASGKGVVASVLESAGFRVHSLSDVVREEAAARGFSAEREHLIRIGNQLRGEEGAGVLARRILTRLADHDVVDSIRNPEEVRVLRALPRFFLLGVTAPLETRFARSLARARAGDPTTLEEFLARERQENATDPEGQQLEATLALADRVLDNAGTLVDLCEQVQRVLAELGVFPA